MGTQIREMMHWAKTRKLVAGAFLALTLMVGILVGTVISGQVGASREQGSAPAALLATPSPAQLSSSFATIVRQVEPSVVNIYTTQVLERRSRRGQRLEFFEFPYGFPGQEEGQQAERNLGSGVIADRQGYILTNHHVIEGATKIQVRLDNDRKTYTARVIGSDEETDLAVIKIEADRELPSARFGNSDVVQVGEWVLAFGSPFNLQSTVTAGIISATGRSVPGNARQFQRFIQTDAAINPGNSGGPLVNMAGEVVGINTSIYTTGRGYDGVGFAMPSNIARQVYNDLITSGRVARGSIGISFQEDRSSNPLTLRELGVQHGIVVESVTPNSPADKAGLQATDVITHVNGKPVKTGSDLVDPIAATPIGKEVRLTYVREGKQKDVTVAVEDRTKVFSAGTNPEEAEPAAEEAPSRMGLRVEELSQELARRMGVVAERSVVVSTVEPASFAEDIGFARGDVILEINRKPVRSLQDFRTITGQLKKGQEIVFRVIRYQQGTPLTVFLAGTWSD